MTTLLRPLIVLGVVAFAFAFPLPAAETLPGTQPLTATGDLSAQMVAGIDQFLDRELEASIATRAQFWKRDFSSPAAYEKSIAPNREHLRQIIGAVDARVPFRELEIISGTASPVQLGIAGFTVHRVRWPVFDGVHGEGLLLEPRTAAIANVIALPDVDQTPEALCSLTDGIAPESRFARRLAEQGCRVLIPVLVSRADTFSGSTALNRWTNLPHREWIWRMAFELGRTTAGFEVQKILAAADFFSSPASITTIGSKQTDIGRLPLGVAGYGEGGLLALHAAALDPRIRAAFVSGYFDSRQKIWSEPGDRAVWSLLKEFGEAEIASLVAPRALLIEHSRGPEVAGPPPARDGRRAAAAPGKLTPPNFESVEAEVERAKQLAGKFGGSIQFLHGAEGIAIGPGSNRALLEFLRALGVKEPKVSEPSPGIDARGDSLVPADRQRRTVKELEDFTQHLLQACERTRATNFWNTVKATNAATWELALPKFRREFDEEVMGKWPNAPLPLNARSRPGLDSSNAPLAAASAPYTAWDLTFDVFPDVFAWGVLLLPKDLKPGERRPVVVCQHGLEGLPEDTITDDKTKRAYAPYKAFSARLAERGFIVFAPHNPYRGQDAFRTLQRKSWPLGKHLFSIIHAQHVSILDWLEAQPFVDPKRIAFYGLSYGGKSAMRIPAVHERYCLSICSGDFNEWVRKNAATDYPSSYLYTPEYEIFEWNLGHTFNYAEMTALIAPRPFMVERGHFDGVGVDEWVNYEYAKARRLYAQLGIADRTEIEHFWGPHTVHGEGTFDFLHRQLNWPKPAR
ncbi:MAG: hypothetical protein HY301_21120 [Verrucomicrobia bacterium]|nr:hypothetical protein [Verrucomicrobiota bacterium]